MIQINLRSEATNVLIHLHVLDCKILENLTVVHIPDGLVIPDLAGQQNSTKSDPLPGSRRDVHLGVCEQPLQVDQRDDGALRGQLRRIEQGPDELVDLAVVRVVLIIVARNGISLNKWIK